MTPATVVPPVMEFNIADFLGDRPVRTGGRTLTLAVGKTVAFTTGDGQNASVTSRQLKLNSLRIAKSDRNTQERVNISLDVYFNGEVKLGDSVLEYFTLEGMEALPKHIYVQNWQTSMESAKELVNHLKKLGWRINTNPAKREGQEYGNLLEASPPAPTTNDAGETDFTNYGVTVDEITIGSTWNAEANLDGFRDFATELTATMTKMRQVAEIEDVEAKVEARKAMSRYILSMTGGRSDGWSRTAQVNNLKISGKSFDLWSSTDEEIDLHKLVTGSTINNEEREVLGQTTEPF